MISTVNASVNMVRTGPSLTPPYRSEHADTISIGTLLGGLLRGVCPPGRHHQHLVDASSVHVHDLERVPLPLEAIPGTRDASQGVHHHAAHRLVVGLFPAGQPPKPEALHELVRRQHAVHKPRAVRPFADSRLYFVELVPYLADQLLDDVLHRYEPLEGAPLVYGDRHLDLLLLKVLEDLVYGTVLGDDEYFAREVAGREGRLQTLFINRAHHVPDMHRTDDPIERVVLMDRVAGVATLRLHREEL